MSDRIKKINELLKHELGGLISRELPFDEYGLITITGVKCSPDLKHAKVLVSVLPENQSGTALKGLRRSSSSFSGELKKKLNMKFIPRFNWQIDSLERHAADINNLIAKINEGEENEDDEQSPDEKSL
jgi:ribosome-binding factor A